MLGFVAVSRSVWPRSSFTNEAESNIEGLTKEHQLLEERCQALTLG